jgi:hypothetical protein
MMNRVNLVGTEYCKKFPLRDDYIWALLRNLKVLSGLRLPENEKPLPPPRSFLAGRGAYLLAQRMSSLEPALSCEVRHDNDNMNIVSGNESNVTLDEMHGKNFDCAVITQPHAFLRNRDHIISLRKSLHPENGIAGFVWVRTSNLSLKTPWVEAFTSAAMKERATTSIVKSDQFFRSIQSTESPMEYFDTEFNLPLSGFKPPIHRKFVEKVTGNIGDMLQVLQLTHDMLRPDSDTSLSFSAGSNAAKISLTQNNTNQRAIKGISDHYVNKNDTRHVETHSDKEIVDLDLDIHLFIAHMPSSKPSTYPISKEKKKEKE